MRVHVAPTDDGAEVSADARFETTVELPTGSMRLTFTPLATADRRVYPLTCARVACTVAVTS